MRAALAFATACIATSLCAAEPARAANPPAAVRAAPDSDTAPRLNALPLGRLFFTPMERAQLDIARMKKPAPAQPQQAAAETPAPPPPPQIVNYGGIIRRSDGKAMLWINNRLVEEKEALAGLNLKGKVKPNGAVTVQVPQTGGTIDVKVGQTVELQTGRVAEVRRPSEEVKPPTPAPAPPQEKPPSADAKAAAAAAGPPAAPSAAPPAGGPQSAGPPANVGLRLDLGSRALQPAEEQKLKK